MDYLSFIKSESLLYVLDPLIRDGQVYNREITVTSLAIFS